MLAFLILFCISFVIYTYIGHPFLMYILSRKYPRMWAKGEITPSVTVFVAAFNEEKHIYEKIKNILVQDYHDFQIVIANDGSSDGTALIASQFKDPRVRLVDFPVNRGKAAMENDIVPTITSEIVIFSDATCKWPPDTIKKIVSNFKDPEVGAVAVDLKFKELRGGTSIEKGQSLYWKYERFLRIHGARFWTNIVVSGTTYAIRRELFRSIPLDVPEDLINPLNVAMSGYRVIFDPSIVIEEISTTSHNSEYKMRTRIATRNVTSLFTYWKYLNPIYGFAAYQFFVHKFCRVFCWVPMFFAFLFNFFLLSQFWFQVLLFLQLSFYLMGLYGFILAKKEKKNLLFYVPYYFILLNWACMIGFFNYCRGIRKPTWQTQR